MTVTVFTNYSQKKRLIQLEDTYQYFKTDKQYWSSNVLMISIYRPLWIRKTPINNTKPKIHISTQASICTRSLAI